MRFKTHIFFLLFNTKYMWNIWDWLFVANILLFFATLFLAIPFSLKIKIVPKDFFMGAKLKLYNILPIINFNNRVLDSNLIKTINGNTTVVPIKDIRIKNPKYIFLLKTVKVKKINTELSFNCLDSLSKTNIGSFMGVSLIYAFNGLTKTINSNSKTILAVSNEDSTTLMVELFLTVKIIDVIFEIIKKGVKNGRTNKLAKSNKANS